MKKAYAATAVLAAASLAAVYLLKPRFSLEGKVVFITGGSRGLGLALAQACGLRGSRLFLVARDKNELERARLLLIDKKIDGARVLVHVCDVRNAGEVESAMLAATTVWGRVDILINDAGIMAVGPAESFTLDDYVDVMQTNFFGALHATLAVMPQMLERQAGHIVNIGSIGGKVAFPHLLPYVASKFALVGWSTGLRTELATKGIQVTTVNPGVMGTGSHVQAFFKGDKAREYAWFGSAANNPFTATAADSAARTIVKGMLRGRPEIEIGLQAKLAVRLANVSPSATAAALSVIQSMLPKPVHVEQGMMPPNAEVGRKFQDALPGIFQEASKANIEEHNQVRG